MDFDFVIQNVSVVDGSGNPAFLADVGIVDDKIAEIDKPLALTGRQVFDGTGLVLAPGFIDVHTHDDTNVIREPLCEPKISQGVTTVIVGNCGISASPATLDGEPPDPMNLLGRRQDFQYPTFRAYVDAVECAEPAVNVAALVGHTTLRNNVMNDLCRPAFEQEISSMKQTLVEALEGGALGLSSGLAYASAFDAPKEELMSLVAELHPYGGIYTTHLRSEFGAILNAMQEAYETAKSGDVPLVISHLKCAGAGNWGRMTSVLADLDSAVKTQDIACDCYPYTASSSTLDLNQVTDEIDIFITWSEGLPDMAGKTLKDIANTLNVSLHEAASRLQPAGAVYHCMADNDVEAVLSHRLSMVGSDGLPNDPHPHPRLWGAFPRVLGHYCREKELFDLETAVHKMTGMSATRYALENRGCIKAGHFADLVLFNPKTVKDTATFSTPKQKATGIESVWVNGALAWHQGQHTGRREGRFLKRTTKGEGV